MTEWFMILLNLPTGPPKKGDLSQRAVYLNDTTINSLFANSSYKYCIQYVYTVYTICNYCHCLNKATYCRSTYEVVVEARTQNSGKEECHPFKINLTYRWQQTCEILGLHFSVDEESEKNKSPKYKLWYQTTTKNKCPRRNLLKYCCHGVQEVWCT